MPCCQSCSPCSPCSRLGKVGGLLWLLVTLLSVLALVPVARAQSPLMTVARAQPPVLSGSPRTEQTTAAQQSAAAQQTVAPQKVILDTDIGDDIDDAYALAVLMAAPNVRVVGVTTCYGQTQERAQLAAKLLHVMGRDRVGVYAGRRGSSPIRRQYTWVQTSRNRPLPQRGKVTYPAVHGEDAVTFLHQALEKSPGEITLIGIGPLTNIADLLRRYPDVRSKIKRIVLMGGAVYEGYGNSPTPTPEYNLQQDTPAAQTVFTSGVPLTMAGLEVTRMLRLEGGLQRRLFAAGTPTTDALAALTVLWNEGDGIPTLFDVMAVAWALTGRFCEAEQKHVVVDNDGLTRITAGPPNVTILIHPQPDAFMDWLIASLGGRAKDDK